jgi:hypothetical protein
MAALNQGKSAGGDSGLVGKIFLRKAALSPELLDCFA